MIPVSIFGSCYNQPNQTFQQKMNADCFFTTIFLDARNGSSQRKKSQAAAEKGARYIGHGVLDSLLNYLGPLAKIIEWRLLELVQK